MTRGEWSLEERAARARVALVTLATRRRDAHLSSSLSIIDALTVLYEVTRIAYPDQVGNHFILSKGHAAAGWYVVLAEAGIISYDELAGFNRDSSSLPLHTSKQAMPLVEYSAGSLGHGLGFGLGVALSKLLRNEPSTTLVLVGDGECNEGSIWEAATIAAARKLGKLVCLVDVNGVQCVAETHEIYPDMNLARRFRAFGWDAVRVDGHDLAQLTQVFKQALNREDRGTPLCIQLDTTAGSGVPFMENDIAWHYHSPTEEQLESALQALDPLSVHGDVVERFK